MRRGDIYLVSLDPTAGHEQSGSRPVLVISPAEFNEATKLPVILPITNGGEFARRLGFAVPVTRPLSSRRRTAGIPQDAVIQRQTMPGGKVHACTVPLV